MSVGDSNDIVSRVKRLIPGRWFAWTAPIRDAILGGVANSAAWCYSLIVYARAQSRIATATGLWLDLIAYEYLGRHLIRKGLPDSLFRIRIRATILQERVTRAGMVSALTALTGNLPKIFEPWNTGDTSAWGNPVMGYGVGKGGWGSMDLPGQAFITIRRAPLYLAPNVAGYGVRTAGYGNGQVEYTNSSLQEALVEDMLIYDTIQTTKASGTTIWTAIGGGVDTTVTVVQTPPQPVPDPAPSSESEPFPFIF